MMVKTVQFSKARYLGDPINAVKVYNDKCVDELVLLDIKATEHGRIDFDSVEDIVSEAFMPIAYGGGVTSLEHCEELFARGVEKIVLNSAAFSNPALIKEASDRFGSQALVISIDVRRNLWKKPQAWIQSGRKNTKMEPVELAVRSEVFGAGEIMLTDIDREGSFAGYDIDLLASVTRSVSVPVIANGGAGQIAHFEEAVNRGGASAVAAGSMFAFAGKNQGVLITYPSEEDLCEQFWGKLT
jgi:cyclase